MDVKNNLEQILCVYNGEKDVFGIDVAPLSIFETQVIAVNVHNLSKSFRPNLPTVRVLSLGTKFIPKWNHILI